MLTILPSRLSGSIFAPPSKSQTMRALLFSLLANGTSEIQNVLSSPDTDCLLKVCQLLGAKIKWINDTLLVEGVGGKLEDPKMPLYVGNSGIALRFLTGICANAPFPITITGDESICSNRPMKPLIKGLEQLGVIVSSQKGYAPITIQGPKKGSVASVNGEDSQTVSGLILSTLTSPLPLEINVTNPGEKPWVQLTLNWLSKFGRGWENDQFIRYKIEGGETLNPFTYVVPGDFSTAAFPIAMALMTESDLSIENLDFDDDQGDKELINTLSLMGALIDTCKKEQKIAVNKTSSLEGRTIDVNNMIDMLPILAVIGCKAKGMTHIINGKVARTKECDRIACITRELKKMGADIEEKEDGLIVKHSSLKGTNVCSYSDHRLAMALTVAAFGAEGKTTIDSLASALKTYPNFVEEISKIGGKFET